MKALLIEQGFFISGPERAVPTDCPRGLEKLALASASRGRAWVTESSSGHQYLKALLIEQGFFISASPFEFGDLASSSDIVSLIHDLRLLGGGVSYIRL
ncbi:hypothetical protein [Cupriavidus sp. D384]|uniref:hypothetical protein n=1 Tax=Cupriavidus sp. D384 TaxID=1538095 RepID=UPI0012E8AD59|nr:hypothetical protein [Cupriavidus sp. D384]